jgi:hypothetical protein
VTIAAENANITHQNEVMQEKLESHLRDYKTRVDGYAAAPVF